MQINYIIERDNNNFNFILIIDRKKFYEFFNNLNADQLTPKTIISYTQLINENDYSYSIKKLIGTLTISFYWNKPNENFSFFAYNEIFSLTNSDLELNKDIFKNLSSKIITNLTSYQNVKHPLFVGGIKFPSSSSDRIWNDFDSSKWFVPKIILSKIDDHYSLTYNFMNDKHDVNFDLDETNRLLQKEDFSQSGFSNTNTISFINNLNTSAIHLWSNQIETALGKIAAGNISKVVLARYKELEFTDSPDILIQLRKLEENFPNCYIFAFKKGKSTFFGASPEKLFHISNGFIETDALAGSIPRGETAEEDKRLETELLKSDKNLAEHKSVVDFLLNQLTPITEKILFDSQPIIKKFQNIQHLYSQMRAKLKEETTIFSLLQKLHPTPAVCGTPQDLALKTINQIEKFDRGMYAGILGWFNLQNEGDFAVGIRSAILKGNLLRAYAGCGIVDGSESVSEYNETELKLKSILSLFENETISKS